MRFSPTIRTAGYTSSESAEATPMIREDSSLDT